MDSRIAIYRSLSSARLALHGLARSTDGWTFDIETYDTAEFPSRKHVATDPHHPDFRVRGIAVATSPDEGMWIDLLGDLPRRVGSDASSLAAAFASDAEKSAFNGGFDENGLVYPGWVPCVSNRTRDGMLAMIALGDGTHERLTLSHAIKVILRREYHWEEDKGKMRDLPVEVVAEGAVWDACRTFELCDALDELAASGGHIEWSKMGERNAEIAQAQAGEPETDPWVI